MQMPHHESEQPKVQEASLLRVQVDVYLKTLEEKRAQVSLPCIMDCGCSPTSIFARGLLFGEGLW
jgi:hypothetical protein